MSKKNKICIDDSQTERLLTDAYKMGKGIDDDSICPTVKEMVEKNVPAEVRIGKAKKKANKDDDDWNPLDWIFKRVSKKASVKSKLDRFIDENF